MESKPKRQKKEVKKVKDVKEVFTVKIEFDNLILEI